MKADACCCTGEGNVFSDRKGMVTLTEQELLRDLHAHPERFSNNVLTRPIMQDCLLPVLGTVLGRKFLIGRLRVMPLLI